MEIVVRLSEDAGLNVFILIFVILDHGDVLWGYSIYFLQKPAISVVTFLYVLSLFILVHFVNVKPK